MGRALYSLLVITFILSSPLCYSQTSVKVSDPIVEMEGNTINITYDILNSEPDEKYSISIVIKDEEGNTINASALDGDIGEKISGGNNKQITWNLEADNIFIDAYIFVQINAKIVTSPAPIIAVPEEELIQDDEPKEELAQKTKTYKRTGIILQSIALPGLGLSRMTGKPHWLRGVAGYGCIAGSIVLSQKAQNTYNGIEDMVYFDDINETYDKALQQENTSNILLYTAAGIWIADLIWTVVGTSDLKKKPYSAELRGFSLNSSIEPLSNTPMVSVKYRF